MKPKLPAGSRLYAGSRPDPGRHPLNRHLKSVSLLCAELARRNGADPLLAARAGRLHDWCKPARKSSLERLMRRLGVRLDHASRRIPGIWHGPVSAAVARAEFGLRDPESLGAISLHSTLGPKAPLLGRILFVADFCAADRKYREAAVGRRIALRDLNLGVRYALASKLAYLYNEGCMVHPSAIALWKSFFKKAARG